RARLQLTAELDPGLARHPHVEDDDVRHLLGDRGAGGGDRPGLDHVEVDLVQRRPDQHAEPLVVVNEQQAQPRPLSAAGIVADSSEPLDRFGAYSKKPAPDLRPRRPAATCSRRIAAGANLASPRPRSSTSMIATHVSSPIRSASASGPSGWRKPSF